MNKLQNHRIIKAPLSASIPDNRPDFSQSEPRQYSQKMQITYEDPGNEIIRQKEEAFHYLRQEKIGISLEKITNVIDAASEYFDKDSIEFKSLFNEIIQVLCDYSMKLLTQNQFERAIDVLMTCRKLTDASLYYEQVPEKRTLVLNNLGCVFRKMGRLGKARIFLEEAFSLVQKFPHVKYSGITYMNICAVVSQAGMHDRAIQYARFGLQECQRQLLEFLSDPSSKRDIAQLTEKVKFTAISFHNIAVEEEYFQNYDKAKDNYRQSYTLFEDHGLSLQDPLYQKFKLSYQKCVQNSMSKNTSFEKSSNKGSLIKLDRPKSSHQAQPKHLKQSSGDGFYFQNNKLVAKNKVKEQMSSTQTFPKTRSYQQDMSEEQNFRQTVKNNYFGHNQSQNDYNQTSPASFKSEQPNKNRRRTSPEFLSNSQRRHSNNELKKEIKDLQLIGILDWSDSDKSEDEFELNKNNRIDFIKQLQGENADESLQVSRVVESPKQNQPLQSLLQEQSPQQKHLSNQENSFQQAAAIHSQPSKQSIKSLKSDRKQSVAESPTSIRNETQMQSNRKIESNQQISKRTSRVDTENNLSSQTLLQRQYSQTEIQAAGKIQSQWKKQQEFKENKKKLVIQNKKKLIVQRQKKIEQSAVVIQKQFRKHQLKKEADFQKNNKKQRDWTICFKIITKVVDQLSILSSHDKWQFQEEPQNMNYKIVKLAFYYNQKKDQMRITAHDQDDNNSYKIEIEQLILNIKQLQQNKSHMQQLNCELNSLQSVNDLKNLARQLKDQVYICSNQVRLFFMDSEYEQKEEIEELKRNKKRISKNEQQQAAIKIQSFQKQRLSKQKLDLVHDQEIKKIKKWILKTYSTGIFIEVCLMQNVKKREYFIRVINLSQKQSYQNLKIEEKHVKFWQTLRNDDLFTYIDIDQEESKIELTNSYFQKLGIRDSRRSVSDIKYIPNYNSINKKSLVKVQALIRGVLQRKLFLMMLEKIRKEKQYIQENSNIYFICKNGFIYEQKESFLFKLYFKPKSSEEDLIFENSQLAAKGNFAYIIIQAINLNIKSKIGKVETIKQKLPARITLFEVQRFSQKILKLTYLKPGRNQQLRIIAPSMEQVMLETQNLIRQQDGQQIVDTDPELQQKLIFNKKIFVQKRAQYKSVVNFCQFDQNVSKNIQPSQIGDLCQKIIYYKYHNYLDQRKVDILITKDIKNPEQLQKKAQLDFPSTEFSKKILSFMENSTFSIEEAVPTRPKLDTQMVELVKQNVECTIQQNIFTLDVYYDQSERHIIVVYQSNENKSIIGQLIINIGLVAFTNDWNIDVLKRDMNELLIQQLRHKSLILYFEENKAMKRRNEALQQQQQQVVNTIVNQVQIQKKEEKQSQLQVFLFNFINKSIILDVNFHPSQFKFIINISQKTNLTAKSSLEIPLNWFSCPSLRHIIEEKDLQGLQKMLYPLFQEILEYLNIEFVSNKQVYTYDLENAKRNMPQIIQNYFAFKIQKKFQTTVQKNHYKFQRVISNQKEIHLNTDVSISTNIYFEKRWYLVKDQFKLKVVIEKYPKSANKGQKKVFSIDLLQLKKDFLELANKKNSNANIDREYVKLMDNKWTDIQGVFSKSYYIKEFSDLIHYLNKQIQVTILYSKIYVTINDTKINLREEKFVPVQIDSRKRPAGMTSEACQKFRAIVSAVTCIQRSYRKFKKLEWQQLKAQRKKEKDIFIRPLGKRVKRAFKEIDGDMYIVNVYQRENIYTFDLILFNERREKKNRKIAEIIEAKNTDKQSMLEIKNFNQLLDPSKKQRKQFRGQYEYDTNQLLNTGAQTIPDYLLDRIAIQEEEVIFKENIFKEFQPGAYQNVKRHEELVENQAAQSLFIEDSSQTQPFKVHQHQSNIASNLVNYSFQEEQGKQFIYNVVYTGQKPKPQPTDLNKFKLPRTKQLKEVMDEINADQKSQLQQGQASQQHEILETEENENNENIVKINVDLNELKKLYPTIDSKSQGLMKVIGEQLIEGIKLEQTGKVLIDQSKLNPKCIEVEEYNVNIESINKKIEEMKKAEEDINLRNKMLQQNQTVQENRKTLLKQTRFFSKQKYLILIYIIERKVKKIQNTGFDTVFEEYEVLYQINCINLSTKNQNPIIWEITPEEVLVISEGIKDNMERARYLMRRIVVFNQKIIFTVHKKQHISRLKPCPNVLIYYELGLIPIQNHFRNRRFRRNFQSYKDEIKVKNPNIIHKCIPEELKSLTQYYLLACVDCKEANDKWELIAWDLVTFERFSKTIKSTEFLPYAEEFGREVTVEFIAKFIDIDPASNELSINSGVSAYFKQYKDELKKKKARRDIVERKKLHENNYS
ncbi:hypothetical protein ABPG74_008631 [Tetrahymena malaccensis]